MEIYRKNKKIKTIAFKFLNLFLPQKNLLKKGRGKAYIWEWKDNQNYLKMSGEFTIRIFTVKILV